ncbi:MAG: DUF192 domain-containing protein [Planctomycetota bacterium]|nr:hypothetical protein [Planctomycetota bacterium]MEE3053350.1 DUF192 domain-containing protein [Planctomycetota bacterium]|tara:strand:+ start:370 stop:846 length:477 start_codon:yes stop_codon:yes gene_type:complete
MTRRGLFILTLLLPFFHSGCNEPAPRREHDTRLRLKVGGRVLKTTVAYTDAARKMGLMHREALEEDEGMLFIFPVERKLSFWMRNTRVPLSIAFIDDLGKVMQIEDMRPFDETSVPSRFTVRYALEVEKGWYRKAGLKVGDSLPEFTRKVDPYKKLVK